ncbi:MAG: hypothetical protein RR415_11740, partial [Ruthenibacterium sp.]
LVEFDTMRKDVKDKYIEIYGNPYDSTAELNILESAMRPDERAFSFYQKHRYGKNNDIALPPHRIAEYTLNARVLNAIIALKQNKKSLSVGGNTIKVNLNANLTMLANSIREKEGLKHSLPTSESKLMRKVSRYKKEGYGCLINPAYGNVSAAKIVDDKQTAVVHKLLSKHTNLDNEQIRGLYNIVAEGLGWEKIKSPNTIRNWRDSFAATTEAGRRGLTEYRNTVTMQTKRTAPTSPLFYWTLDGWDVELFYQKTGVNKDGKKVTTYHNRLTIVVVLDPCKKYPIGYAIGERENTALIRQALRNALLHSQDIFGGDRYKPFQLQSDNYQKGNLLPFYEAMTKHYTPARVHNAKSKVIEPYFRYLNKTYCQMFDNWSGFNITSDKSKQPNTELLNKNHSLFPDEAGVRMQIEQIMQMERNKKITGYMKAWGATKSEDKLLFGNTEYLLLMGETTGFTNSLTGAGLTMTINGVEHVYDSFDSSLRNHMGENWVVRYDENNLNRVLISNATRLPSGRVKDEIGTLRFELEEKSDLPMALKEQKPEHFEERARIGQFNSNLEQRALDKMIQVQETVETIFNDNPQLNNTLARLVICDSRGQHKDERNDIRLGVTMPKALPNQRKAKTAPADDEEDYVFDEASFVAGNF